MDWNKIRAEYISGGTSYRKLAEKYKVPLTTLMRTGRREAWVDLRLQAESKANAKIVNDISNKSAKIDDKYYRLVDMLMNKAEEVIKNTPTWHATNLKEMATALKYLKECKGVKSEADIREQMARIAKLEKEAREQSDKSAEIVITIDDEAKDYAK